LAFLTKYYGRMAQISIFLILNSTNVANNGQNWNKKLYLADFVLFQA